ncbi:MAG: transposase [Planctomycetes bacterium]|uniref:transposase n=1 Tax=Candidatus Wunengus sp. YC65 TaxID=3367701 RepID=UPI001D59CC54|nr:transposase [Planctomycetota bacterium]
MDEHKFQGKYRIESTRLKDYDYSLNGAYFVTVCTKNSMHLFGSIVDQKLIPNRQAEVVTECWLGLPAHYTNCVLDKFIIMPNHVHGIIIIDNEIAETGLKLNNTIVETGLKPVSTAGWVTKPYSLSEIIRGFKTFSARRINEYQNTRGKAFWQSRFYDHIIRNREELKRIRQYIIENPLKWELEKNNHENLFM